MLQNYRTVRWNYVFFRCECLSCSLSFIRAKCKSYQSFAQSRFNHSHNWKHWGSLINNNTAIIGYRIHFVHCVLVKVASRSKSTITSSELLWKGGKKSQKLNLYKLAENCKRALICTTVSVMPIISPTSFYSKISILNMFAIILFYIFYCIISIIVELHYSAQQKVHEELAPKVFLIH